jgi:signal peptidase II
MTPRARAVLLLLLVCTVTIALDRYTKRLAEAHLPRNERFSYLGDVARLEYVENRGAFLGMGGRLDERTRFLLFTVGAGLGLALVAIVVLPSGHGPLHVVAWGLILAGGASNLVDRAFRSGLVIDFMNLGLGPLRTGIFNVADVAITTGAALVLLSEIQVRRRAPRVLTPSGDAG